MKKYAIASALIKDKKKKKSVQHRLKTLTENQFPSVVQIWEDDIVKLPVPSNLTKPDILRRLYEKTGGTIGLLDRVLRRAAILSLKKGNSKIDRETLDEVLVRYE